MKTHIQKSALRLLLLSLVYMIGGCTKHKKDGAGQVMFYTCDNCIFGEITIEIDSIIVGTLDKYLIACDPYDGQTTNVVSAYPTSGTHTYRAYGKGGQLWEGNFDTDMKNSTKIKLECILENNTLPSNFDNQGTITVSSQNLQICARDFSTIDGDKIDLVINGSIYLSNFTVSGTSKCITVTLPNGNNWIGIIAKDEGSIPPCTPGISINDGFQTKEFEIRSYVNGTNGGYIIRVQ